MSVVGGTGTTGLVARVQNILMRPAAEWDVIDREPATVSGLFTGYACILAAIPAVLSLLSSLLFVHWTIIIALVGALLNYVLGLAAIYVIALIVDALAPSFGAQRSPLQALKLIVYSYTAVWVAGFALIIPILGGLVVLAGLIYSYYLLWVGLPKLMKVPADKAVGYFIVTVLVGIGVYIGVVVVEATITGIMLAGAIATGAAMSGVH